MLDRIEVLARARRHQCQTSQAEQAVEMLRSMSFPTEADRLLQHLRRVDADALLSSSPQGPF